MQSIGKKRYIRIYHPQTLSIGEEASLNEEASHHIGTVLRLQYGDVFTLFDGHDHEYDVCIQEIKKKHVRVIVTEVHHVCRESTLAIHLAQGIAKGDRMTFSLQKAVELGVSEYTPIWTQHAAFKWDKNIDSKKWLQWQNIMQSASEQCGRTRIPKLNPIISFDDFLKQHQPANGFMLEPSKGVCWQKLSWQNKASATLLIGPEGGFSFTEIDNALHHDYQALTLGPRILRTETAVVSALSILQATQGDL